MNNGNGKQHARIFFEDLTSMLDANLSRCAMTVYLALRIRSVPGGDFWTDHGTLSEMFATTKNRFHPKSVSRAIAELCDAGFVKRAGDTNRTRYLVMDCPWVINESVPQITETGNQSVTSNQRQESELVTDSLPTGNQSVPTGNQSVPTGNQSVPAYPSLASPQAASRVPNKQDLYLEQTRDKTRNKQTSLDENSPDLLAAITPAPPQQPTAASPKKNGHARDEAFARFWEAYPRKVGKHAARQVFDKIKIDPETADRIVAAADAYRKKVARDGTDPQYIKHPSGWLNARRWEDEPEPEKYTLHHVPTDVSAFAGIAF